MQPFCRLALAALPAVSPSSEGGSEAAILTLRPDEVPVDRPPPGAGCADLGVRLYSCASRTRGVARTSRTTGATSTYHGYRSMAGVAAFGGTGFAIRPPRHQRLEKGQHGRSVSFLRPPGDQAVGVDPDTPAAPVRNQDGQQLRCSFCQAALGGGIELTSQGAGKQRRRTSTSSFCSTRARDCVLALAELHPSPLASSDFISKRACSPIGSSIYGDTVGDQTRPSS